METIDAFILGLVQGLAEYLPISSSGHLAIFRQILGIELPGEDAVQFDLLLHAATVLSTIVVLWPMFSKLVKSFFTFKRDADFWYVCKLLISCIPVGIVGVFFKDYLEAHWDSLTVVGVCLCVTACLLTFAHYSDRLPAGGMKSPARGRDITWWDAFIIGCSQAVAVLPGLSRSGTTIATGIIIGDKREKVAAFSFLMVIIPILGEALLDMMKMLKGSGAADAGVEIPGGTLAVGFFTAFVVGCLACKWMLNLVKKGKLVWFAVYCLIMGAVCLIWG